MHVCLFLSLLSKSTFPTSLLQRVEPAIAIRWFATANRRDTYHYTIEESSIIAVYPVTLNMSGYLPLYYRGTFDTKLI